MPKPDESRACHGTTATACYPCHAFTSTTHGRRYSPGSRSQSRRRTLQVDDVVKAIGDLDPTSVNAYLFEDVQKLANSLGHHGQSGLSRVADAVKVRIQCQADAHALREMLKERIVETKGRLRTGMWRQPASAEQPALTAPQPQMGMPPPVQPTGAGFTRSPMADKIMAEEMATSKPTKTTKTSNWKTAKRRSPGNCRPEVAGSATPG